MKQKSAYWIKNSHLFDPDDYECSACGSRAAKPSECCPSCGKRMSGQQEGSSWVDEAAFMDFMSGG